jgi:1-deoxy-D-xylulose-5-phosphate reductoisomerase
MAAATPEQAINHPKWRMGAKISVDSATLMNKGLELIEAHYLFHLPPEKLDVVVHPESIIHSFVHYHDGSVLAQLGMPDMCTPLAVALAWPERIDVPRPRLDLTQLAQLQFEAVDEALFPCLSLAKEALAQGGSLPAVLNAANEEAVAAFLKTQIGFAEIASVVEAVLARAEILQPQTLAEVVELDHISRCRAREYIARQRMQMLLLSLQQEQLRNAIQAQSQTIARARSGFTR